MLVSPGFEFTSTRTRSQVGEDPGPPEDPRLAKVGLHALHEGGVPEAPGRGPPDPEGQPRAPGRFFVGSGRLLFMDEVLERGNPEGYFEHSLY